MSTNQQNPLFKHFRQPQIHLKLPSGGQWWAPGSLELPVTGEIPVYAMTAKDEIIAKTPDALLNGSSTVDVIQSCCPSIKDAWKMPTVDLDAVLIAIRTATYGNEMEFTSICPHCGNKNENTADLNFIASRINCPDFESTVKVNGLEIYLKPQNFYEFNRSSMRAFEEQRVLAVVQNDDLPDVERIAKFNQLFQQLVTTSVNQVVSSVAAVKTEDGVLVEDPNFINDFFQNCDRPIWEAVKNRLEEISDSNALKHINLTCHNEECGKTYDAPLVFELSSFFG